VSHRQAGSSGVVCCKPCVLGGIRGARPIVTKECRHTFTIDQKSLLQPHHSPGYTTHLARCSLTTPESDTTAAAAAWPCPPISSSASLLSL
jgi:hypothetical protein